jgi:hypothetical protein
MEAKYSKGSKTLADLKNQLEKEHDQEVARCVRNKEARMKKDGFFTKAQEMIDYIFNGKRIVAADDPNEYYQLRDGKVFHRYLTYNDIDMPIGYSSRYETIEEFKNWVAKCEEIQIREHKTFVNYFFKKEK